MAATIEIKGMKELQKKLKSLIKSIKEPKKFFGFASLVMFQDVMEHFKNEEGPKGKWKPLKERTLIHRRLSKSPGGTKILQDKGDFRGGITHEFSNRHAVVGLKDIRATTHQKGRGKIPARPFIWYSKNADDRVLDNFMLHLKRGAT